jgi:hypothetical protein
MIERMRFLSLSELSLKSKRQTKCMVDICGCFAIQAAGVMSAMR